MTEISVVSAIKDGDFVQIWVTPIMLSDKNQTVVFGQANWLDNKTIGVITNMGCVSMPVADILSVTETDGVYDVLHNGLFLRLSPKFVGNT